MEVSEVRCAEVEVLDVLEFEGRKGGDTGE